MKRTTPPLLEETRRLHETTKNLSPSDLKRLMKLSDALAELNHQRFRRLTPQKKNPADGKQAALAFDGDTYVGLRAGEFSPEEMEFAQQHLIILSGLYGLLRPLDVIQPYRLEMGTRLKTDRGASLYDFWGDRIARRINLQIGRQGTKAVINLASQEYASVIPPGSLRVPVITPVFKEVRGGVAKVISFNAKRARGAMARYIVSRSLTEPSALKRFRQDGYRYQRSGSDEQQWLFLREAP